MTSTALLACVVGLEGKGFRETLAIEMAGTEKERPTPPWGGGSSTGFLHGVRLVVSDHHEGL